MCKVIKLVSPVTCAEELSYCHREGQQLMHVQGYNLLTHFPF